MNSAKPPAHQAFSSPKRYAFLIGMNVNPPPATPSAPLENKVCLRFFFRPTVVSTPPCFFEPPVPRLPLERTCPKKHCRLRLNHVWEPTPLSLPPFLKNFSRTMVELQCSGSLVLPDAWTVSLYLIRSFFLSRSNEFSMVVLKEPPAAHLRQTYGVSCPTLPPRSGARLCLS